MVKWLSALALALIAAAAAMFAIGWREAELPPIERHVRLALPGWPETSAPMRIALVADIHFGDRVMDAARLNHVVEQVNAARPDLVLLAGDFVGDANRAHVLASLPLWVGPLAKLRATYGVIAVLGNHDHWTVPRGTAAALEKAGVTVLANAAARRGAVTILGVDDVFSRHADLARTIASARGLGGFPVIVTHSPDLANQPLAGQFPLMLAGHTHCGQVVLPVIGPVITSLPLFSGRRIYDPRYRCGVIRKGAQTIVVTAGVGTGSSPIRLGAPSDWWLVELGPAGSGTLRPRA